MDRERASGAATRLGALSAGLLATVAVSAADVMTGFEINLGLFYLVPIGIVTWWVGRGAGIALAATCAIGMLVVDRHVTRDIPFPTHEFIPYWNTAIRLGYFVAFAWLLSALRRAHARERLFARQDFLTGVANGQAFYEAMNAEIRRSRRSGKPISVAYLDCDNFKAVNDDFGHGEGDRVLRETATTIRSLLRDSDLVARLGGDEFAMLLADADAEAASRALRHAHAGLLEMARFRRWPVTYSIGVVTFLTPPHDAEHAIRESDRAMYDVKGRGKNNIELRVVGGDGTVEKRAAPLRY